MDWRSQTSPIKHITTASTALVLPNPGFDGGYAGLVFNLPRTYANKLFFARYTPEGTLAGGIARHEPRHS